MEVGGRSRTLKRGFRTHFSTPSFCNNVVSAEFVGMPSAVLAGLWHNNYELNSDMMKLQQIVMKKKSFNGNLENSPVIVDELWDLPY